jgi:hypothetical protein
MRVITDDNPIRPLKRRSPSRLRIGADGRATTKLTQEDYKKLGGKDFLLEWMNSPQYQKMMSGKEYFTAENSGGHSGWLAYDEFEEIGLPSEATASNKRKDEIGDGAMDRGETNLIKVKGYRGSDSFDSQVARGDYLTEEELYGMLRDLGYGDNPSITDMRKSNIGVTKISEGPGYKNQQFVSRGRPVVELNYKKGEVAMGSSDQDPGSKRLTAHELSHASDTNLYDLTKTFGRGESYPRVTEVGGGFQYFNKGQALIPAQDERLIKKIKDENYDEASTREKAGESLGRFAGWGEEGDRSLRKYYTNPTEIRARLNVIRKLAGETGVYDPFNEPLTMEGLQKLYDDMNENMRNRSDKATRSLKVHRDVQMAGKYKPLMELNKYYTKEQILEMLNEIAQAEPSDGGNASGMRVLRA